jgi:hypothetical protein
VTVVARTRGEVYVACISILSTPLAHVRRANGDFIGDRKFRALWQAVRRVFEAEDNSVEEFPTVPAGNSSAGQVFRELSPVRDLQPRVFHHSREKRESAACDIMPVCVTEFSDQLCGTLHGR